MTISYHWLKEYVDIPESPDELAHILTSTGLEVESVEAYETIKGGLKGLVVGEVLTCSKHPNADKLSLTTVATGGPEPLKIVCGAPNVAAEQKVIVAVPGTTIHPTKGDPFTIRSARIRGEQSEGMICAEDEIGIGEKHDGILVLNTDLPNGTPAARLFEIYDDIRIEIGLTPNRADAASHIGVARDLRASKNRVLRWPDVSAFTPDHTRQPIEIKVENTEACPRYTGMTIEGVTVKESPAWLRNRLMAIGITPINNIVDITNFVCHELGQPLHAFDAAAIQGNQVIVKTLPFGTPFTTLDNKERKLFANDLMICDARGGMCIAGVFGGVESGITHATSRVFLESACFSPLYIRKTSQLHQLKTDASFRFERGTDPELTVYAIKRAALLIKEIAGGTLSGITDIYPSPVAARRIPVKQKNINRLIGIEIPESEVAGILSRLDIALEKSADGNLTAVVPPYRVDVLKEADIVEEVLRIYGFNNIPLSNTVGTGFLSEFPQKDPDKFKWTIGELLNNNGFNEIWTNSLTNRAYHEATGFTPKGESVEILNKLSEEQGILRQSMLFTGLEVCAYNINRRQKNLRLYEFGKIYSGAAGKYDEESVLALYITGNSADDNWQHPPKPLSYYDLAQQVHQILHKTSIRNAMNTPLSDQLFEYGNTWMQNGVVVARGGKVKENILKHFGIKQELFYAELNTTLLFNSASPKFVFQEVPKFPEVRRDLSLVLDKRVTFDDIKSLANQTEKQLLQEITLFDVYQGDKIPADKKAYALGFTLLDEQKTLTDQDIDKTMDRLMRAFEQTLGAVIRR